MIPDYETLMLPLLKFCIDGKPHRLVEVVEYLAPQFSVTEDERKIRLKSGVLKFDNKVAFAKSYLKQAGLIELLGGGLFKITSRGMELLQSNLKEINNSVLLKYPEFVAFKNRAGQAKKRNDSGSSLSVDEIKMSDKKQTPEDLLELGYEEIQAQLKQELLQQVKSCSPRFFEHMVVELLVKMGYGGSIEDAGRAIGRSGDEGIDGFIKEDKLGLDVIYLQAKRWQDGVVGRPEIQKFVGALQGQRARKGIFITTSSFSREAIDYAKSIECKVILIDAEQLADLMVDYNLGVTPFASYELKRVNNDYFSEE
jgi:restriction system protein